MKTTNVVTIVSSTMVRFFLITLCVFVPQQLSYAQNKVVVIPLFGDDTPQEPTAPVAKVDPSATDYTIMSLTTIDNITGLEWQRIDDDVTRTWNVALDYCADLILDGKTDWRLPDVVELQSIVDYGLTVAPIIDSMAFPDTDTTPYWSASSLASSSVGAWVVFFSNGEVNSVNKALSFFVRCVR